jgi:hypothetical protein
MAKFYDVPVHWKDKTITKGRGIGNNAAWQCKCRGVLLDPYEDLYPIPQCPSCGLKFKIVRGKCPQFVDRVVEQ